MEILTHYILPNVALFGSIYFVAKLAEHATWHFICNYDNIVNGFVGSDVGANRASERLLSGR